MTNATWRTCRMAQHMTLGTEGRFRLHCVLQLPSDGISLLRVHVHGRERYHRRGSHQDAFKAVLSIDESVDFVLGQMGQLNVHRFVVCTRSILHIR